MKRALPLVWEVLLDSRSDQMTEKDGNFCYSPMKLKKRRINGSALVEEFFLCGEKLCGIVGQAGFDQPRGAKGVSQNQGWTGILETLWVGGG